MPLTPWPFPPASAPGWALTTTDHSTAGTVRIIDHLNDAIAYAEQMLRHACGLPEMIIDSPMRNPGADANPPAAAASSNHWPFINRVTPVTNSLTQEKTMAYNVFESPDNLQINASVLGFSQLFIDWQMLGARTQHINGPDVEVDHSRIPPMHNSTAYSYYPIPLLIAKKLLGYSWANNNYASEMHKEWRLKNERCRAYIAKRRNAQRQLADRLCDWSTADSISAHGGTKRKWVACPEFLAQPKRALSTACKTVAIGFTDRHRQFINAPTIADALKLVADRDYRLTCSPRGKFGAMVGPARIAIDFATPVLLIDVQRRPFYNKLSALCDFDTLCALELAYRNMVPHPSETDPKRIAYLQSWDKFVRFNRETGEQIEPLFTVTSPGKFLTKVAEVVGLRLDDEFVKNAVNDWNACAKGPEMRYLDNDDPKWADNRRALGNAWYDLYNEIRVDYSCMRGNDAVRCYGLPGNHLRLVWWEDYEGGKMGRAICRTDTTPHQYVRVYPCAYTTGGFSEEVGRKKLEAAGYEQGDLMGIQILAIEDGDGRRMCPYIDAGSGDTPRVEGNGRFWAITDSGGYEAQNTDAYGYPEDGEDSDTIECNYCEGYRHQDDMTYSPTDDAYYCCDCINNGDVVLAMVSRRRSHYVSVGNTIELDSGEIVYDSQSTFNDLGVEECDHCGAYTLGGLNETHGGNFVCDTCWENEYSILDGYDLPVRNDLIVKTHDGRRIHRDDSETRADGLVYHVDDESDDEELAA